MRQAADEIMRQARTDGNAEGRRRKRAERAENISGRCGRCLRRSFTCNLANVFLARVSLQIPRLSLGILSRPDGRGARSGSPVRNMRAPLKIAARKDPGIGIRTEGQISFPPLPREAKRARTHARVHARSCRIAPRSHGVSVSIIRQSRRLAAYELTVACGRSVIPCDYRVRSIRDGEREEKCTDGRSDGCE